jgi:hypothetical protein
MSKLILAVDFVFKSNFDAAKSPVPSFKLSSILIFRGLHQNNELSFLFYNSGCFREGGLLLVVSSAVEASSFSDIIISNHLY